MTEAPLTMTPELLAQLAEKSSLPLDYLTTLWEEKKAAAPSEQAAIYDLSTALKAQIRSPAVPCEGVIFEVTEPFDYNTKDKYKQFKELKTLCKAEGNENFSQPSQNVINQLIAKRYVDSNCVEGQPLIWLDIKPASKAGKDNANYGKPWPPAVDTTIMNVRGICKPSIPVNGQEVPMGAFELTISDPEWFEAGPGINNVKCLMDLQTFKPFDAKLIYHIAEAEKPAYYTISTTTEFTFEDAENMDIMALCRKFMPEQVQNIKNLPDFYAKHGTQNNFSAIFECGVVSMRMTPSPIGMRTLYVDDPNVSPLDMFSNDGLLPDLRIDIPESIEINFARGTRAIIIGQVKQKAVWVQEKDGVAAHNHPTEKELYVQANTVYPIPQFTVHAKKAGNVSEEQTEGWGN